ncbi:MAG: hypothetical protein NTY45_13325 [Elusimicrobia bacterium]|nr:hypothetical protein [Elusimicrobiota bacterium]
MDPANKKGLVCASYGLYPEQITFETISALKKCDKLFLTDVREGKDLLFSFFPKAELVSAVAFEALIQKVMKAFSRHDLVGVMDYGDPSFLCNFSERLRKECVKNKIGFKKYQAVSSLNTIISDLGLGDLSPAGLYLATAHSWSASSGFINPAVPFLLFSPDRVRLYGDSKGLLAYAVKDIQRIYPPAHEVCFIGCKNSANGKNRKVWVKVARLGQSLSELKFDTTLYIPAVTSKKTATAR